MKFQDILRDILRERINPPEDQDEPMIDDDGNEINPDDQEQEPELDDDEIPANDPELFHNDDPLDEPVRPTEKKLSRTQTIKTKWKAEAEEAGENITEQDLNDAVAYFNQRKDSLRPYKPFGTIDPRTQRHYINLPEITSLLERFPDMKSVLIDEVKMKDLMNYSWKQINFYMNRIYQQAIEAEDINWVPGDLTEDQRIQIALERWKKPYNRIINEGNLIVYKIECKEEAIALGALAHAIFRKYREPREVSKLDPGIQRVVESIHWGAQPWCVARPVGGKYGENLWTNYRPPALDRTFYFVLDNNKAEYNPYHIASLQPLKNGGYMITTFPNQTARYDSSGWGEIGDIYPLLRDKENLFPWFGPTDKEKNERKIGTINFRKGDPYDFAVQHPSVKRAYIENGNYVRNIRAFLTLSFDLRKFYIDKATNDDYKDRFICDDPNNPFGILKILRIERKPDDLYKYLDEFKLKGMLGVPEGIMGIKKYVIGTVWRRWYEDIDTGLTLISEKGTTLKNLPKCGIINLNTNTLVKTLSYKPSTLRTYGHRYMGEDGVSKIKKYLWQRYDYITGTNMTDPTEYFYFLYLHDSLTDRNSRLYFKGKYFEGPEGDTFIQSKVNDGSFKRI